jgi:hypothetical protein
MNGTTAERAFQEYQFVAEDTAKISDRRQTVNTLFVSINALFISGVGYLLYLFFSAPYNSPSLYLYLIGFGAIVWITTSLNNAWLSLSEFYRRLIDLRIRYLESLEGALRQAGDFSLLDVLLRGTGAATDKEYEAPPAAFATNLRTDVDPMSKALRRWMRTRGTYTLEQVLYQNPDKKKQPFGFSRAEQRVGNTFTWSYWLALAAAIVYVIPAFLGLLGIHAMIGPLSF